MPIYNVELTLRCTIVVQAENIEAARDVAHDDWKEAIEDADTQPMLSVAGEVTDVRKLRDGWDGMCVPYGGDRNTRLNELLPHNPCISDKSDACQ